MASITIQPQTMMMLMRGAELRMSLQINTVFKTHHSQAFTYCTLYMLHALYHTNIMVFDIHSISYKIVLFPVQQHLLNLLIFTSIAAQ